MTETWVLTQPGKNPIEVRQYELHPEVDEAIQELLQFATDDGWTVTHLKKETPPMKDQITAVHRLQRLRTLLTGRVVWVDPETGEEEHERWGWKDRWQVFGPTPTNGSGSVRGARWRAVAPRTPSPTR